MTRTRQPEPCSVLHSSSSAPTTHARAHGVCEGVNLAPVRTHFSKQHPLHQFFCVCVCVVKKRNFTCFFLLFSPPPATFASLGQYLEVTDHRDGDL